MERSQVTVVFGRAQSCYLKKISIQYVLRVDPSFYISAIIHILEFGRLEDIVQPKKRGVKRGTN
jgi:hypothetical protein